MRVFEQKSTPKEFKDDSDFKRSEEGKKPGKKSTPDKDKGSSDSGTPAKTKLIKKRSKREEYLNFYKYYFERLGAEHPRWSKNQINTIIKLLWRKRTKTSKRTSTGGKKGLSGRQLYRRDKEK